MLASFLEQKRLGSLHCGANRLALRVGRAVIINTIESRVHSLSFVFKLIISVSFLSVHLCFKIHLLIMFMTKR